MNVLRTLALAMALALGMGIPAHAQTPASPPAGLSQQQFDSLVDAISNSVTEKLKAEGAHAPAAAPAPAPAPAAAEPKSKSKAPPPPKIVRVEPKAGHDPFAAFIDGTMKVAHALPTLGTELARIPGLLDQQAAGGRSASTFLLLLIAVGVVAVAAEATGWRAYDPQEAEAVSLDEAGCEATLEIYLTVMDQLRPSSPGELTRVAGTR